VQANAVTEPVYAPQDQWTITPGATEQHPGCWQNNSPSPTTYTFQKTLTRLTTFTWSVTETLSVMWKYSTTVKVPDAADTTSEWQVTLSFSSTQSQTVTKTEQIQENLPIPIPANTTMVWLVTFTDQTYSIPFSVPVQLTGSVAIKSTMPVPADVLAAIGGSQIEPTIGQYLVIAPIGSFLQYGISKSAGLAALSLFPSLSPRPTRSSI
jgi:hypothetical protein